MSPDWGKLFLFFNLLVIYLYFGASALGRDMSVCGGEVVKPLASLLSRAMAMDARNSLRDVLFSVGFDPEKLRIDAVLDFLIEEEIFSLEDFEGGFNLPPVVTF